MTNEQLVTLIRNHENEAENMLLLWQQNRGIIKKIAWQYKGQAELEDLEQEGFIGLCNAVQGYDQDNGSSFVHYAAFWIRQAMRRHIDNCCSCVRIPVGMREKIQQCRKLQSSFYKYYGRKPTDNEIRLNMGLSWQEYQSLQQALNMSQTGSLDKEREADSSDESCILADLIAGPDDVESEVLDRVEQEELKETLWPLVDDLPDQQPVLIRSLYVDNLNLKDASERTGIEYNRARAMRDKALRTLRLPSRAKKLLPFITPQAVSMAYSGGVASFERTWTSSTEWAALFEVEGL